MTDMVLQENPEVSPKLCYFCGTHAGPFVNTMVDDPTGRIILLCAPSRMRESGCAGTVVNVVGGLTPSAATKLKAESAALHDELHAIRSRLERLRDGVVEAASVG